MDQQIAKKILEETERGYDFISGKFSQTRKHVWRGMEFVGKFSEEDSTVLDFGCGNGRLLCLIADVPGLQYYGVDVSERLIEIAKSNYYKPEFHFRKISPIQNSIPFNDEFFNTSYSIAVFHHFPSKKYREELARELFRVTKKDGRVVITVWNLWQRKYITNIMKNWYNKFIGESELDWNDCHIGFRDNEGNVFQRFHHAFTKRELEKLFSDAGFKIERCEVINTRNIVLVGKKIY